MMDENRTEPQVSVADPKAGWCNGCSDRPPYEPNETTAIKSKTMIMSYCPKCTVRLAELLTDHARERGFVR